MFAGIVLKSNNFPSVLKLTKVVPIYKGKGNKEDLNNFRPISITPVFSKILEKILFKQLLEHFEKYGLFNRSQFGFRNGKSTTTAILELMDFVTAGFTNGCYTTATFFDLTKAFDCVSHDLLIQKLSYYNICADSCELINSFLSNRRQYVWTNNIKSNEREIHFGVPQGSILGPLLFLVYINDLPHFINNAKTILYADDTTLLNQSTSFEHMKIENISTKIDAQNWFLANRLGLNDAKTKQMLFSLRSVPENNSQDPVTFLGVTIGANLSWESHVEALAVKLCRSIYCIRGLQSNVPRNILVTAYHALFESHINYALLAWGHSTHAQRIFRLQRRVVRVICNLNYRQDCRNYFVELGVMTLPSLYIFYCLNYMHLNKDNYKFQQEIHNYGTRGKHLIRPTYTRVNCARYSKNYYCILFYNVLPDKIKCLSFEQAKDLL